MRAQTISRKLLKKVRIDILAVALLVAAPNHEASGSRMDGADWPQRDGGHPGAIFMRVVVFCTIGTRPSVLRFGIRRCQDNSAPGSKPESKRVRGTVGSPCQAVLPVQRGPLR